MYRTTIIACLIFSPLILLAQSKETVEKKITKEWELVAVKEFGKKYDPGEERADDKFHFKSDHTVEGTYLGEEVSGKWSYKNDTWLYVKHEGKATRFKMISIDNEELIIEYQDPESLVRTKMIYEPVK